MKKIAFVVPWYVDKIPGGAETETRNIVKNLTQKGIENIVFEKDDDCGGLCGNFEINGFRFDKAIHLSFTTNEYVKDLFSKSTSLIFE